MSSVVGSIIIRLGTDCIATGWGDVNKDNPHIQQPEQLQFAKLKIADFKTCQKNYRKVKKHLNPKRHICADGGGTVDTCQGDSGGPLVCMDVSTFVFNSKILLKILENKALC